MSYNPKNTEGGNKMADGVGCTCAARSQHECACNADWTPQEVLDLRGEVERLKAALVNARASFLGLMPDENTPIRTQMAAAIRRINTVLYPQDPEDDGL